MLGPDFPSTSTQQRADGMFRVLELLAGLGGGTCWWVAFSTCKIGVSLSIQVSCHVQFVLPVPSGNGLEGFGHFWWSWSPPSSPSPHPLLHVIPICVLYCAVPISRSQNKEVCPRKMLFYLCVAPISSHILLFLPVCFIFLPVCFHSLWLSLLETHVSSFLLSFYIVLHPLPFWARWTWQEVEEKGRCFFSTWFSLSPWH